MFEDFENDSTTTIPFDSGDEEFELSNDNKINDFFKRKQEQETLKEILADESKKEVHIYTKEDLENDPTIKSRLMKYLHLRFLETPIGSPLNMGYQEEPYKTPIIEPANETPFYYPLDLREKNMIGILMANTTFDMLEHRSNWNGKDSFDTMMAMKTKIITMDTPNFKDMSFAFKLYYDKLAPFIKRKVTGPHRIFPDMPFFHLDENNELVEEMWSKNPKDWSWYNFLKMTNYLQSLVTHYDVIHNSIPFSIALKNKQFNSAMTDFIDKLEAARKKGYIYTLENRFQTNKILKLDPEYPITGHISKSAVNIAVAHEFLMNYDQVGLINTVRKLIKESPHFTSEIHRRNLQKEKINSVYQKAQQDLQKTKELDELLKKTAMLDNL